MILDRLINRIDKRDRSKPQPRQCEQKYSSRAAEQYRAHLGKLVADQMAAQQARTGELKVRM